MIRFKLKLQSQRGCAAECIAVQGEPAGKAAYRAGQSNPGCQGRKSDKVWQSLADKKYKVLQKKFREELVGKEQNWETTV